MLHMSPHLCQRYFLSSNHRSSDAMRPHRSAFTLRLTMSLMWLKLFKSASCHFACSKPTLTHPPLLVIYGLVWWTCDWTAAGWNPTEWHFFTNTSVVALLIRWSCCVFAPFCTKRGVSSLHYVLIIWHRDMRGNSGGRYKKPKWVLNCRPRGHF